MMMFSGRDLDYDPVPILRSLQMLPLWILGEQDKATPSLRTHGRLMALKPDGHPICVVSSPNVAHGLHEFGMQADERVDARQPESLQRLFAALASGAASADSDGCADVDK